MRRFLISLALLCGFCACAAAQRAPVEIFDRSGLPTRPKTDNERQLMRRISAHKPGDVSSAVAIQRDLAAYYRGTGDDQRARAAEERAKRASGEPGLPDSAIPVYQPETAAPAAPDAGTLKVPQLPPDVPLQEALPAPAAPPPPAEFSGRFFVLQGGALHSWEFRQDGTFEHAWAPARGTRAATTGLEAGTYRIVGPYLMLAVLRGGRGPGARQFRLNLRGPGGRDGILLDGMLLKPKAQ